jgi:hypothetical protein
MIETKREFIDVTLHVLPAQVMIDSVIGPVKQARQRPAGGLAEMQQEMGSLMKDGINMFVVGFAGVDDNGASISVGKTIDFIGQTADIFDLHANVFGEGTKGFCNSFMHSAKIEIRMTVND